MDIAVTGASGHIGSNLCRRLLQEGHSVRAQYLTDATPLDGLPLLLLRGDVCDPDFVHRLVGGADAVFHLAARISIEGDPDGTVWETNVGGTRIVASTCARSRVRRLVHFSSIHAFNQDPGSELLDEYRAHVGDTAFVYDRSKAEGERIIREAVHEGLDAVILNPTAVMGPADFRPSAMGGVLIALAAGRMPVLVDGGFDWVDVRDVVEAALVALDRGRTGRGYLLSGRWASLQEVARLVDMACGRPRRRVVIPVWIARTAVPLVGQVARLAGSPPVFTRESLAIVAEGNRRVSCARAKRELGFSPRPLDRTVADTLRWFEHHSYI